LHISLTKPRVENFAGENKFKGKIEFKRFDLYQANRREEIPLFLKRSNG
jgi:hypothetical protein